MQMQTQLPFKCYEMKQMRMRCAPPIDKSIPQCVVDARNKLFALTSSSEPVVSFDFPYFPRHFSVCPRRRHSEHYNKLNFPQMNAFVKWIKGQSLMFERMRCAYGRCACRLRNDITNCSQSMQWHVALHAKRHATDLHAQRGRQCQTQNAWNGNRE